MAGRKPQGQDPGPEEERVGGWREDLEAIAMRLLSEEDLARLRERAGDLGQAADLVVAAHLDDVLFVERARFHRARRELGRAMATDDKEGVAAGRQRLLAATESVALVRLQRDLATGEVKVPLGGRDKSGQSGQPGQAGTRSSGRATGDREGRTAEGTEGTQVD